VKLLEYNSSQKYLLFEKHIADLQTYLKENLLDYPLLLNISIDISTGLFFLHNNKPNVIHQQLSSLNILLKDDLSACIGDFKSSLILDEKDRGNRDIPSLEFV
jgi:hypothetical protein